MTEPELREKFIELSAAQLKEFGVEGSPYLVNRFAVLVWKKLLPFTTQYGNQRKLAILEKLRDHEAESIDELVVELSNIIATRITELKAKEVKGE